MQDYHRRVEHANEKFRTYTRAGWKTDRGRTYILYGAPNDVERYPNNPLSYGYEVWNYEVEGGVIFVFADLQEFGEYTQPHFNQAQRAGQRQMGGDDQEELASHFQHVRADHAFLCKFLHVASEAFCMMHLLSVSLHVPSETY